MGVWLIALGVMLFLAGIGGLTRGRGGKMTQQGLAGVLIGIVLLAAGVLISAGEDGNNGDITPTPTSSVQVATPTRLPETPTPVPENCWNPDYVADVTVPDGTRIKPGEPFVKTWRILNNGVCDWEDVRLVFTEGDQMQASTSNLIPVTLAGEEVEVSVLMVAPSEPGDYSGKWSFCRGEDCFGWVTVVIVAGD